MIKFLKLCNLENTMKRLDMVCRVLLVGCFLAMLSVDALAQAVNVKVEGMSPGKLAKIGKSANMSTPGIKVVGKGAKVYLKADTTGSGATAVTSYTWSLASVPAGSTAALDSSDKGCSSFTPDIIGQYIVQASVNGGAKTDKETLFVSTYMGNSGPGSGLCATCHSTNTADWKATNHATLYTRAMVGQVEVNAYGLGTYGAGCFKCHTTGYDVSANNGNFGYLAKQTGWDTTWYKGKTKSGTSYMIANGDSSIYTNLVTNYASVVPVANIGCESCHGPAKDHNGDKTKIAKSLDAGVCLQCHDAPTHHMIGSEWNESAHSTMAVGHASSTGCYPCHSGTAFAKWVSASKPATMTTWSIADDATNPIACATCHDPHSKANANQLRTVDVDTLKNGYVVPTGLAGKGQLCMNCHRSRYDVAARVKTSAPYYGFVDHYGPHGNPQADMFLGQNGYQYGDASLTGLSTHTGLADGCVTCHMPGGKHSLDMVESTADVVDACKDCHGAGITKFDDVKASYDYDRNGKIEGVQTEVTGLLAKLKAKLPIDDLTGEPTLAMKDSLKVKNRPDLVQGIYTYSFVKNDASVGVHNTKYAVSILQKALGFYPTGVKVIDQKTPSTFALSQNYPNPFNPKTDIQFSIPRSATIQLNVYNILGELVATLASGDIVSGNYTVSWNGTNRQGTSVSSGIYFYRLAASSNGAQDYTVTKKMLMTK